MCDEHDPTIGHSIGTFTSWVDFVDRVAQPMVESESHDEAAYELYKKASPYFICVSLVMAANRAGLKSPKMCEVCGVQRATVVCIDRQGTQKLSCSDCGPSDNWEIVDVVYSQ